MPSIHIPEDVFSRYSDAYGYDGAKEEIKDTLEEHAPGGGDD